MCVFVCVCVSRDRWNGYNPDSHKRVIEEYEKIEMAKRKLKEERLEGVLSGKLPESEIMKVCIYTCEGVTW